MSKTIENGERHPLGRSMNERIKTAFIAAKESNLSKSMKDLKTILNLAAVLTASSITFGCLDLIVGEPVAASGVGVVVGTDEKINPSEQEVPAGEITDLVPVGSNELELLDQEPASTGGETPIIKDEIKFLENQLKIKALEKAGISLSTPDIELTPETYSDFFKEYNGKDFDVEINFNQETNKVVVVTTPVSEKGQGLANFKVAWFDANEFSFDEGAGTIIFTNNGEENVVTIATLEPISTEPEPTVGQTPEEPDPAPAPEPPKEEIKPIEEETEEAPTVENSETSDIPTKYTYQEALDKYNNEKSPFYNALRPEKDGLTDQEKKNNFGRYMPEYFYTINPENNTAERQDVVDPIIIENGSTLTAQLPNGDEIKYYPVFGWVIPQFSTKVNGNSFVNFAITVDSTNRETGKSVAVSYENDPSQITPAFGFKLSTPNDLYNSKFYDSYINAADPKSTGGQWYEKYGYGLENSSLGSNSSTEVNSNQMSEEVVNVLFMKLFTMLLLNKKDITQIEFNAVKNYTFGSSDKKELAKGILKDLVDVEYNQPLSVDIPSIGSWELEDGVVIGSSQIPGIYNEGWYGHTIGSGTKKPFHTQDVEKDGDGEDLDLEKKPLYFSSAGINTSGWSVWSFIIQAADDLLIEEGLGEEGDHFFTKEAISIIPGREVADGNTVLHPLRVIEALDPSQDSSQGLEYINVVTR
jgi:hypothetical protein